MVRTAAFVFDFDGCHMAGHFSMFNSVRIRSDLPSEIGPRFVVLVRVGDSGVGWSLSLDVFTLRLV
jgi:hypothetical protein